MVLAQQEDNRTEQTYCGIGNRFDRILERDRPEMKRILTALTLSAVLASPAWSEYTIIGNGNVTCGEFVEYHDEYGKSALTSYEQWMWGFFTGLNVGVHLYKRENSTVGEQRFKAVYAAVLKHCRDKPLDRVFDATYEVFETLR